MTNYLLALYCVIFIFKQHTRNGCLAGYVLVGARDEDEAAMNLDDGTFSFPTAAAVVTVAAENGSSPTYIPAVSNESISTTSGTGMVASGRRATISAML